MKSNKLTFRSWIVFIFLMSGLILVSCYPGDPLTPADTDVVATFHKPDADFSAKMTYAMPDSIIRIDGDGNPVNDPGPFDAQIIARIKQNMNQLGYTEVQNPANADLHIVASVTTTTWVSGGCYSWWYSYWYPYPGYCYPVAYTYRTGSLLFAITDPSNQGASDALWIAGINGILEDSGSGLGARLNTNIDQAFKQSPYLGEGK
jgi:hypothetical protein